MDFVGSVCVPYNELPVLRCGDKVALVDGPMKGVYLRQMALQRASHLHCDSRDGLDILRDSFD